jgi:hypothetical protein
MRLFTPRRYRCDGKRNVVPELSYALYHETYGSRDSVVGIATGYGLDGRGVGGRVSGGSRIFSSPRRPDRIWGPTNPLSNGCRGLFPRGKAAGA